MGAIAAAGVGPQTARAGSDEDSPTAGRARECPIDCQGRRARRYSAAPPVSAASRSGLHRGIPRSDAAASAAASS